MIRPRITFITMVLISLMDMARIRPLVTNDSEKRVASLAISSSVLYVKNKKPQKRKLQHRSLSCVVAL
jgi:hypothetical protein